MSLRKPGADMSADSGCLPTCGVSALVVLPGGHALSGLTQRLGVNVVFPRWERPDARDEEPQHRRGTSQSESRFWRHEGKRYAYAAPSSGLHVGLVWLRPDCPAPTSSDGRRLSTFPFVQTMQGGQCRPASRKRGKPGLQG